VPKKWLIFPAMIGGAACLADGMINQPISVTSAIYGLRQISVLGDVDQTTIMYILLVILAVLFFAAVCHHIHWQPVLPHHVYLAFNARRTWHRPFLINEAAILNPFKPYYAIKLLTHYPKGFWRLVSVFLCTTGAYAVYAHLGHCARGNIRIACIFCKRFGYP